MQEENKKRRGLILSGGGANGAFQVGAMRSLIDAGYEFDVIAGVSVGAINGALYAQDEFEVLEDMWLNKLSNDKVYKRKVNLWNIMKALLFRKSSILSNKPLQNMLNEYLDYSKLKKNLVIGTVDLVHGTYESNTFYPIEELELFTKVEDKNLNDIMTSTTDFYKNIVLASTVIPLLWKPVKVIRGNDKNSLLIDGGVRNNIPAEDLNVEIDRLDEVVVISCNPSIPEQRAFKKLTLKSILERSFKLVLNEGLQEDIGDLPKNSMFISPSEPLGDMLDFSKNSNRDRYYKGKELAQFHIDLNKQLIEEEDDS